MDTTGHRDNPTRLHILTIYFEGSSGGREGGGGGGGGRALAARPLRIPKRLPPGKSLVPGAQGPPCWPLKGASDGEDARGSPGEVSPPERDRPPGPGAHCEPLLASRGGKGLLGGA